MKKIFPIIVCCLAFAFICDHAAAYWIWTPATKKFINPKYAVKDSPKEQFDWAMSFYTSGDYQRAATEFEKLTKQYEFSEYAGKAQYYVGRSYEQMGKLYLAFQNYQKAIDNFPHIDNVDEIIGREFDIANTYLLKSSPRILGTDIITSLDRSIEIYKKVVDNAPYGKFADEALFKTGEALKRLDRYDEAIEAFQKIADDYQTSKLAERARYEVAYCAYRASLRPEYASEPTEKAIKAFEEFAAANKDSTLSQEAEKTVQRLKDKAAEKSYLTAKFYDQVKQYRSAVIYYQEVTEKFPESSFVGEAQARIAVLQEKIGGTKP